MLVLALDLRRLRFLNIRFIRLVVAVTDPDPADESDDELSLEEESSEDDEEFIMSWRTPGWDSSSIFSCGMLSYMYAWLLSWKSR